MGWLLEGLALIEAFAQITGKPTISEIQARNPYARVAIFAVLIAFAWHLWRYRR